MHRPLRLGLVALAAAAALAGCGNDDDPQAGEKASKGDPKPVSYYEAKQKLKVGDVDRGEVSIRNRLEAPVQCDVPGYQGGRKFEVPATGTKFVSAKDVDGKKIVDVTCGDQRVSDLNVTPDSEGAELEYVDETTFRQRGYRYVHWHYDGTSYQCNSSDKASKHRYDWAADRSGSCEGFFLEGSPPYTGKPFGVTRWERLAPSKRPRGAPNESIMYIRDSLLDDDRRVVPNSTVECWVTDPGSPNCYTDYRSQEGKPAGTEGGPLRVDAHMDQHDSYLFIRGWCRKGDKLCTPH